MKVKISWELLHKLYKLHKQLKAAAWERIEVPGRLMEGNAFWEYENYKESKVIKFAWWNLVYGCELVLEKRVG